MNQCVEGEGQEIGTDEGVSLMDIIVNTQGLSVVVKTALHAKEKIYLF